ncbi:LytR family transcriptional regulator [Paenibacillus albiflavus]|uniref:LytR family transcriptional regulator n=1 Tax=Paenibacillus albiflavus TaxID=2545760 RepID=A0A4R4DYY8_9BACL|nr:LytTR family transcriptional regulator DNA-binding domain-containing protein [Paenibacillus albiflavus]TCZ71067.1 LytR family transcriptional regulator [Paenibacillus albiflavus]
MAILEFQNITKKRGNSTLLAPIHMQIHPGQCCVIQCNSELGNLIIQLIIGQTSASEGSIYFKGKLVDGKTIASMIPQIGIGFLKDGLYERLTVKQYLQFFQQLYGVKSSFDWVIEQLGLIDKRNVRISELTYSEQRRLQIARILVHDPVLVVLEEPEQNVDLESCILIRSAIAKLKEAGKAILITTAFLENAISITNDVYRLNEHGFKKLEITSISGEMPGDQDNDVSESEEQLTEAVESFHPMRMEKIPAKVEDKIILFDPTEIDFIESSEGVSTLHVGEGLFPCAFTLNDLEEKLKLFGFFRCHRSYIVNLQKVREVITWTRNSYSLILDNKDKTSIPLSKGKFDEMKRILGF